LSAIALLRTGPGIALHAPPDQNHSNPDSLLDSLASCDAELVAVQKILYGHHHLRRLVSLPIKVLSRSLTAPALRVHPCHDPLPPAVFDGARFHKWMREPSKLQRPVN
jgi:hypothetical protein